MRVHVEFDTEIESAFSSEEYKFALKARQSKPGGYLLAIPLDAQVTVLPDPPKPLPKGTRVEHVFEDGSVSGYVGTIASDEVFTLYNDYLQVVLYDPEENGWFDVDPISHLRKVED